MRSTYRQRMLIMNRLCELRIFAGCEQVDLVNEVLGRRYRHFVPSNLSFKAAKRLIIELDSRVSERRQRRAQRLLDMPAQLTLIDTIDFTKTRSVCVTHIATQGAEQ